MASPWKHQKFARHYFEHQDVRAAAKAAGSRANTPASLYQYGYTMLHDPRTQSELEKLRVRADERTVQSVAETRGDVHDLINEGIDLARKGVPIIGKNGAPATDEEGNILYRPDINGLLKGAELKGKTVAMFTDRQEIAGEMDGKSEDELFTYFIAALLANPMLVRRVCSEEVIIRGVHEHERRSAEGGEGAEGDAAEEAESLSSAPEAGGISSGRVH